MIIKYLDFCCCGKLIATRIYLIACNFSDSMIIFSDYIIFFRVVIAADAPYIKMVSEQFDRCHGTLLQYVEFLCSAVNPCTAYAQLVPSLNDLVHQYHLDPEVCLLSVGMIRLQDVNLPSLFR